MFHRHAQYSLGDFKSAASAFRRGLEIDPSNASLKTGLQNAEARIVPEENETLDDMPPLESPAVRGGSGQSGPDMSEMLRNMGMGGDAPGAGGGGGMPDLASMMSNPAMMQMAQQMMQNGGLERLMQNPALANMVRVDLSLVRFTVLTRCSDERLAVWRWNAFHERHYG